MAQLVLKGYSTAATGRKLGGEAHRGVHYDAGGRRLGSTSSRDGKKWRDPRGVQWIKETALAQWLDLGMEGNRREAQISDLRGMCTVRWATQSRRRTRL